MPTGDLERGEQDIIKETAQSLLVHARNEDVPMNQFSPIHKAAPTLREASPSCFNPRAVAIGPVHREDKNVKPFQMKKANYMFNLIYRTCCHSVGSSEEEILKSCLVKVYGSMKEIRAYYVWPKTYDDTEIAEMMVMDSCFLLEFIYDISVPHVRSYPELDKSILYDLVLLGNQVPFFILDEIFQCTILKCEPNLNSLVHFLRPLVKYFNIFDANINFQKNPNAPVHILSLLHKYYTPEDYTPSDFSSSTSHSAVELDRVGVIFLPKKHSTWVMRMEVAIYSLPCFFSCFFCSWPTLCLEMPQLKVNHFTELVLRNLIAFEQSFENRCYMTSYAIAMDRLVNTQEDVAKLVESEVLVNDMGSNEEAANMINNLCKGVAGLHFFYGKQWKILDKYYKAYWPKRLTWFRSTYFISPWNMIALLGGISIFVLTLIQTVFTIMSTGSNK